MSETITAVYENGVLRPLTPLIWPCWTAKTNIIRRPNKLSRLTKKRLILSRSTFLPRR
ncbi:MAG: antitoxin family protein [Anaerolineae bacterium]|nr:antitoxin family protein [Anaerolineae bacterium]